MTKGKGLFVGLGALAITILPFAPIISVGCACIDARLAFSKTVEVWPYAVELSASRAAILKLVPIGAQREEVEKLMFRIAALSGQMSPSTGARLPSECSFSADRLRLTCYYNEHVSMFALVKRGFSLDFRFDEKSKLQDLVVHKYLQVLGKALT